MFVKHFLGYLLLRNVLLQSISHMPNSYLHIYNPIGLQFLTPLRLVIEPPYDHIFKYNFKNFLNPSTSFNQET